MLEDAVIKFNARGHLFTSLKQNLLQRACPKSPYFEAMLSGKFAMVVSPEDGAVFLDRNPDAFKVVWNYLLDEPLSFERYSHGELQAIRVEADYFQVDGLVSLLPLIFSPKTRGVVVFSEGGTVVSQVTNDRGVRYVRSIDPFILPSVGQVSVRRMKMIKQGKDWYMQIGLAPESLITDPEMSSRGVGWFLSSDGCRCTQNVEKVDPYCKEFGDGTVVTVKLHHDKSVSFLVDGVDHGAAFTNVDVSQPLFLMVKLANQDDMVQLV